MSGEGQAETRANRRPGSGGEGFAAAEVATPQGGGWGGVSSAPPLTNARAPSPLARVECRRCGHTSSSGDRFCADCGAALDGGSGSDAGGDRGVAHTLASIEDELQGPRPTEVPRPASMRPAAPDLSLPAREARCPECHATNSAQSLYCMACGHGLGGERPPEAPRFVGPAPRVGLPAAGARPAYLAVVTQDGLTGETHRLEEDWTDIGREEGAIRLASDPTVCPRHARIHQRGGQYFLQDLGSVNGVYLRLRQPTPLTDGDLLLLGAEVLRFHLVSHAEQGLLTARERGTEIFGSPKLPRYACLFERTVEGVTRNVFYITRNETVIGRESGDIVFTFDSFMSRRHAALRRDPQSGQFTLRDLGSSNGTYLAIRAEVPLADGEHVRIGQHLFRFGFGS